MVKHKVSAVQSKCRHEDWTPCEIVGYTGDWFNPRIVQRTCRGCGKTETKEM